MRSSRRNIASDILNKDEYIQPINQRAKGVLNERNLAKWLKSWTGEKFCRVPSSGGLRWKNSPNTIGDVVCEDQDFYFPFTVETKHLKKLHITKILRANSEVFTIWDQAKRDAERAQKLPLLFLRRNGMPKGNYYVVVEFDLIVFLPLGIIPRTLSRGKSKSGIALYIFDSNDFLRVDYKVLTESLKNDKKR